MPTGDRIKKLRISRKITQSELANFAGVRRFVVKELECGEIIAGDLSRPLLQKMADYLGVPLLHLLCLDELTEEEAQAVAKANALEDVRELFGEAIAGFVKFYGEMDENGKAELNELLAEITGLFQ